MSDAAEQRRLAAIMFTDMVGYSALSQRDSKLALELLEEHRVLVRKILPEFNGTEIKTIGDAFLIEFNSALEAAQCAIAIQRTLAKRNADAPAARQIQLRIGVHIGDVVHRDGDVYGDGVNIASRIEPLAGPGGICISTDVERQIHHAIETRCEKLAPTELKNISVPMDLFRIVLPWERPGTPAGKSALRSPTSATRRPRIFATAGAIVLLLAGLAGYQFWRTHTPPPSARQGNETAAISRKSIAVLPFQNLSRDPDNAFFTDGVQDQILSDLAQIADLKVISRTSVMQYKSGPARNLRKIGEELGVAHVVEGSVQRTAHKIRVSAQLIDARNDAHLWAQTFDRDLADVFAIQSEIARAIADQLHAKLSPSETTAIAARLTQNTEAYDLYLRGKELVHEYGSRMDDPRFDQSVSEAVNLLEKAVALDPNFALAHCLLVEANLSLYWHGQAPPGMRERAQVALEAARRLAPQAGETYLAEALFFYWGYREYERALESLEKAARASPNNVDVFRLSARVERRLNRWPEAIRHGLRAIELDPRGWEPYDDLIRTYTFVRQYAAAERLADRAVAEFPDQADHFRALKLEAALEKGDLKTARAIIATFSVPDSTWQIWMTAFWEHNYEETRRLLRLWADRPPSDATFYPASFLEALAARAAGDSDKARSAFLAAREHFSQLLRERGEEEPGLLSQLGVVAAGLGQKEEALRHARRAVELLPPSRDNLRAADLQKNLAFVYCWSGERDRALDELAAAAKMPGGPSYGELKFDPRWDGLKGDPRFERIVASLAPKT